MVVALLIAMLLTHLLASGNISLRMYCHSFTVAPLREHVKNIIKRGHQVMVLDIDFQFQV